MCIRDRTGNPREIIVEAEIKTYAQVSTLESLIHQRLAKYRIHGEWFNYGEDGIQPYVELTKKINEELEVQIKDNLLKNQYALIEDNGEELKPSSDAKDIHNELLEAKKEIIKIKNEKDLANLKSAPLGSVLQDPNGVAAKSISPNISDSFSALLH